MAKDTLEALNPNSSIDIIQYPSDLQSNPSGKYMIHFTIQSSSSARVGGSKEQKISNPEEGNGNTSIGGGRKVLESKKGAGRKDIFLYMPENITEAYAHDWENVELGAVKRFSDLGNMALSGRGGEAMHQMANQFRHFVSSLPEAASALNTKSLLERNTGIIVNPNIELLYKGTQLKSHSFVFKFIPKNKTEALNAKRIVEMFKYYSAPRATAGDSSTVLFYPEVFNITFRYTGSNSNSGGLNEGWLHKIQPCALTNIEVNYTGAGQFAALNDGAPVHIEMTLQFQELTIKTKHKIYNDNAPEIQEVLR